MRGALAALGVALVTPSAAAAQAKPPAESYAFAFQNADIAMVVQEVLGQAGVPFAIDPAVSGKISFRIEQRLTREQLLAALEAVLAANNVAMVRTGDTLTVTPAQRARATAEVRRDVSGLRGAGYEIVAVPLGYAPPTEVARALEAIAASDTVLYSNDKLGLLLLGGSGQQLRSALETIKVFDQSAFLDSKIRWFELGQAQASTVAGELERIVLGAKVEGVTVVPLRRLNGVIVFARSKDVLDEVGRWVTRLDVGSRDMSATLFVYRPQFGSAESLAKTLAGLVGGGGSSSSPAAIPAAAPASPGGPPAVSAGAPAGGEDEVRISVDKDTNTQLFFATPTRWVQIQRILGEIDRPQRQVLIEASIVEVTLGKAFQMGVDWSVFSRDLQVSAVNNRTGEVGPSFPGLSVTYINADIAAAVNALGSRTNIEIVSAPKIIALDNRPAHLQIGDQVPVVTQSSQSRDAPAGALVNTIDYRSTGVILNVTPRISGQDRLVLEVTQEVSSVAKTSTSGIDSPTIQQRRFESALMLENGATVALGGLISTTRSHNDAGIPFLKDLPVAGPLFRSTGQDRSRSELIVLLSARIIDEKFSSAKALEDLASDMRELAGRGLLPTR